MTSMFLSTNLLVSKLVLIIFRPHLDEYWNTVETVATTNHEGSFWLNTIHAQIVYKINILLHV